MKNIFRIALFFVALFSIKLSGRAFMLSLIVDTEPSSLLPTVVMTIFFVVAVLGLFVSFGEQHFPNIWLLIPSWVGACALAISVSNASCSQVSAADLNYNAYFCTHPELKWVFGLLCAAFMLIVALRRFEGRRK